MKVIVFVGPSLPLDAAKAILPDAIFLPPAGQADIVSVVGNYKPDIIALIDGVFLQSLSVWHKEILYAIEKGVQIYGSSSMGALRAAETNVFGMIGVGRVYELYASGEINDDDEVAIAHDFVDGSYKTLSEPMVNLRATFDAAAERGVIDEGTRIHLTAIAKRLYFPNRVFPLIFKTAVEEGIPTDVVARMKSFVKESYVDLKRQDAILLLETIRDMDPESLNVEPPDWTLNRTHLFQALYERDRTMIREAGPVTLSRIATYTALHKSDFNSFNFNALNFALADILAEILDVQVMDQEIAAESRRFVMRHRLKNEEGLRRWMHDNNLSEEEFTALMKKVATVRKLQRWLVSRRHMRGTAQLIVNMLHWEDEYTHWADQAASQEQILEDQYPMFMYQDHTDQQIDKLLTSHLLATDCRMDVHFPVWLEEAGFESPGHLWIELLRAKLFREAVKLSMESGTELSSD